MGHNRIGTVTGISGCGKDFLLGRTRQSGGLLDTLPIVSFGEELSRKLKREAAMSVESGRDQLRSLPPETISHYTGMLLDEMIDRQPLILNSHTVYVQGENLVTNLASQQRLKCSHYLFVAGRPEDIANWRVSDTERQRPQETLGQIELHQAIALGVVRAMAEVMDSRLLVVHNTSEDIDANTQRIGDFLSSL